MTPTSLRPAPRAEPVTPAALYFLAMRRGVNLIGLPWFACAVFAMTGCSEPPSKEHDQAVAAIAAADRAGAAQFAATDLGDARAALAKYDGYVADRDYKLALATAIDARDRAYPSAS